MRLLRQLRASDERRIAGRILHRVPDLVRGDHHRGERLLVHVRRRQPHHFVGRVVVIAEIGALDMPSFHVRPSAPTNLTLHEAIDINVPIGCGDAPVFPGDVVVGDDDGCIVIPAHLADEIAAEAVEMTAFEDFVSEQVMAGRSILGLYPPTDEQSQVDFAAWRSARSGR